MPKTKQQKQATVQALRTGLAAAPGVVFANFQGLSVAKLEELRRQARLSGIKVLVAKKTILRRALEESDIRGVAVDDWSGGVATFFGSADEVAPAQVVATFAKTHEVVRIFGGMREGKFIDEAAVKYLASIPGRAELLSRLVGSLQSPLAGLAAVLSGTLRNFVGVLGNIQKAKA
ncbi:MAG: 50S ribosomal protein L10 [Candidatus Magasanikbacteria bacterium]|nr:50S ribosomal protein L10 [Candidatus Magasanikbacteria bacterium]